MIATTPRRAAAGRICGTAFLCVALTVCSPAPQRDAEVETPAGETATREGDRPSVPRSDAGTPPESSEPKEITIETITAGNPLIVTGLARTFENNVIVRARSSDGTLIRETFTTSDGEMGRHNPYRASIWLTRHPGKRVVVEALEYSAKDGSERSLVSKERDFGIPAIAATLYFPDEQCTAVKPFEREMPRTISMARLLVEALIAGPVERERAAGSTSPFPQGSEVRSVNLRDGVLTVDFNERLQNVGGACRATMIRSSVTETLTRLPSVTKVVITAGGSESLALQP